MSYMITHCPICEQLLERYFPASVYAKIEFYCKGYGLGNHNFMIRYNVETHNLSSISVREGEYWLEVYNGLRLSIISKRKLLPGPASRPDTTTESKVEICKVNTAIGYDLFNPPELKTAILPFIAFA